MTTQLPQLHEGRSDLRETIKLVNLLRRNLAGPAALVLPCGSLSLLTLGQTLAVPANANGWITTSVILVPDVITGAQATGATIRLGSNATFDNVFGLLNLGIALVVGTAVSIAILATQTSQSNPVYLDVQTAGTGPTVLNATVYVSGFYR